MVDKVAKILIIDDNPDFLFPMETFLKRNGFATITAQDGEKGVELAKKELQSQGEFTLPGLGVLRVRVRKATTGRNPRTGEPIRIPRKKVVRFRAYKDLRELVNPAGGTQEMAGPTDTGQGTT